MVKQRHRWLALPVLIVGAPLATVALGATLTVLSPQCGAPQASANLPAPPPGQLTAEQMVRYLVGAGGLSTDAAAGIVGNLVQESGLKPAEADGAGGGGLAQWKAGWFDAQGPHGEQSLDAFARSRGLSAGSDAAQLEYLVYDLHTAYAGLLAELNSAPDPATAATMFETAYERCSGVVGYMQVTPGSLCRDPDRRAYAVAALEQSAGVPGGGNAAIPVSLDGASACLGGSGGYADPFARTQGLVPRRIDMGVDYDGSGEIDALGAARVTFARTGIGGGWVCNTPVNGGVVYQLLDGADQGRYVYVAEDVIPTVRAGATVGAGQPIANIPPNGCIEIGWSTTGSALNPEAAALGQIPGHGDAGSNRTYCGQQMSDLLASTGAPGGIAGGKPLVGSSC